MIEKFTPEELEQIRRELGIIKGYEKTVKKDYLGLRWNEFLGKSKNGLIKEHHEKMFKSITEIIDYTLCNFKNNIRRDRYRHIVSSDFSRKNFIEKEDIEEYENMFMEIIEIIKKHERICEIQENDTLIVKKN